MRINTKKTITTEQKQYRIMELSKANNTLCFLGLRSNYQTLRNTARFIRLMGAI